MVRFSTNFQHFIGLKWTWYLEKTNEEKSQIRFLWKHKTNWYHSWIKHWLSQERCIGKQLHLERGGGFAPVLLHFIRILKQGDSQVSAAVNPASLGHIKQRHITQDLTFHAPQSSLNAFADTTGREGRAYKFMRWAWEGTHSHEQGEGDENRREKKGERRRRRKRSEKHKKGTDWSREEREKAPWAMGGASKLPNSHFLRAIQCLTKGLCRCVCQCVCPLEF